MLWGLTPAMSTPAILIGLVAYRLIYFLLPLGLATVIWGLREGRLWYRRHRGGAVGRASASGEAGDARKSRATLSSSDTVIPSEARDLTHRSRNTAAVRIYRGTSPRFARDDNFKPRRPPSRSADPPATR